MIRQILDNIIHEDLAMPQPDKPVEKVINIMAMDYLLLMCLVSKESVKEVLVNEVALYQSYHWQL